MKIIALQGVNDTGKTATLKKLLEKLIALPNFTPIAMQPNFKKHMAVKHWDAWAVFEHEGSYIGVTSRGDLEGLLSGDFDAMDVVAKQHGVSIDTYVCAIHTGGKTLSFVKGKAGKGDLQIFGKATLHASNLQTQQAKQDQINNWQADLLLSNL